MTQLVHCWVGFDSVSDYLIERIPEMSFLLSSIVMIFVSDYLFSHFFLRRLKRMAFITRTALFVLYGLVVLPVMITLFATSLRVYLLEHFQNDILLVLIICFVLVGVLLSIRYNMRIRLRVF
jgi:hypothetical protein